ncbi:hypothetical protein [Acidipropionibacterium acidipropionici]|uniref:Uncharacterized protein n=1 Tax=Acidipropionibacterium acidipropionici TaxID=1748 RepID=A0AAC9AMK4_9ACTN|nr:hypothetical protein [Acidipropionibacterium acidipropionici]AMS04137.1 hypothetical protein AXH35_00205 [Acidipropionibacterium acidipropionici]
MPDQELTAAGLIRDLQAQGWSQARIAAAIGRDSRTLRFVLAGTKPGHNLVGALHELSLTGQVTTPIPRRRTRTGKVARVRGRRGQPSITPTDPTLPEPQPEQAREPGTPEGEHARRHGPAGTDSTRQPERRARHTRERNLLRHEVENLPRGRSSHLFQFPRVNETARGQADSALMEILDVARQGAKRMHAKLWIEVGPAGHRERREVRIGDHGGYDAGLAVEGVGLFGGSVLDWMTDQAGNRYEDIADTGTLVGVEIDIW